MSPVRRQSHFTLDTLTVRPLMNGTWLMPGYTLWFQLRHIFSLTSSRLLTLFRESYCYNASVVISWDYCSHPTHCLVLFSPVNTSTLTFHWLHEIFPTQTGYNSAAQMSFLTHREFRKLLVCISNQFQERKSFYSVTMTNGRGEATTLKTQPRVEARLNKKPSCR